MSTQRVYLDSQFGNGSDGAMYEFEVFRMVEGSVFSGSDWRTGAAMRLHF